MIKELLKNICHGILKIIRSNKLVFILSIIFIILYCVNLDKFPHVSTDENWFCNPAYMFINCGKLGTTLMYGFYNMQNYTYWQPPLYLLLLSVSFKFMGLGVFQGRIVSILLGLTSMIFTYALAKELYNKTVGIIASSLLTFNLLFFFVTREMRMEIAVVCFSLIAIFLIIQALKKSNMTYFLSSGMFTMMAFLSHPNGLITILTVYILIFVYYDFSFKNKLRGISAILKEKGLYIYSIALILVLIPYTLYISIDFTSFKSQFIFNIGHSVFNPLNNILMEPSRYLVNNYNFYNYICGINISPSEFYFGMIIILLLTAIGIIYALKNKSLEDKLLLSIILSQIVLFGLFVSNKRFIYLSILLPYWSIIVARIFYQTDLKHLFKNLFNEKHWKSSLVLGMIIIFIVFNLCAITYILYLNNSYDYYAVESEISNYIPYNSTVIGDPYYYLALAKNYNYYSQPNNYIDFDEYESISNLKPDYILFGDQYHFKNFNIKTQRFVSENYKEIGTIPLNNNIEGSPIIIYKKIR